VFGDPGAGKSAAVKTMLHRWVGLHRRHQPRRWLAVCDPKGEYRGLARVLGLEVLALRPGGPVRLNPLDIAGDAGEDGRLRRAGSFDGASTVRADRQDRGVVVDLSAVHGDRTVLGVVMAAATAWIAGHLARRDGVQRIQVIDEAWALLSNPASVRHLQASWKL